MRRVGMACALMLAVAGGAMADVRHEPVRVRLVQPPPEVTAGQPLTLTLEVESTEPAEVTNLRLEGRAWTAGPLAAAATARLERRAPVQRRFQVRLADPREPITVRMEIDGKPWVKTFDLSHLRPGSLRRVPESGPVPPPGSHPVAPPPETTEARSAGPPDRVMSDSAEPARVEARTIRMRGRLVYERSDGVTIGADGAWVRIYDEDVGVDELLATGSTGATGYFDLTFTWDPCPVCDQQPDLYAKFEASNTEVVVQNVALINYHWSSGTTEDYAGTDLNIGWQEPEDEGDFPALHILTNLTRDWRWYLVNAGYNLPRVDVMWPDGTDKAWYNDTWADIHIGRDYSWYESTDAHEYGHHWVYTYAVGQDPDYCNGYCDQSAIDCRHCVWCPETGHDAWNEGWPNWIAHVQTSSYLADYGIASQYTRDQEAIDACPQDGLVHTSDAEIVEGFMGALLQDIWDSNNEDDPSVTGSWRDRLSLGYDEIITCADSLAPRNPTDFLNKFKQLYPAYTEALWETGKNCGYDLDTDDPGVVTSLVSTSHSLSTPSPDPTIAFSWAPASDDWSGVSGYSVVVAATAQLPDMTTELGDVTVYTTATLTPGTYYISIRARDLAGHWSPSYASKGPYIVRAAEPANLTDATPTGWGKPVVPRASADAVADNVPLPTGSLPGNGDTWWNFAGINNGETTTSSGFMTRLYVDGDLRRTYPTSAVASGAVFHDINDGPVTIPGGRHVFSTHYDDGEGIAETDETDNVWGRQWVWSPYTLTANTPVTRVAPSWRQRGWDEVSEGAYFFDCDGLRFSSSGWWNAVSVVAADNAADYDCRLHFATSSPDTGFGANRGYSQRSEGYLDAVLVNRNTAGLHPWDVGVINRTGDCDYTARHVTSTTFAFDDSANVTIPAGEYLLLREVPIAAAHLGPVSVTARIVSGTGPVTLAWLDRGFTTGGLSDADWTAVTPGAATPARIDLNVAEAGYHAIVLYRDPKDGSAEVTVVLEVETTPPDYAPYQAAGWYAPMVPRPADDGTPGSVPLPDTLYGNMASTYMNFAVRNFGPTGNSARLYLHAYFDGESGYGIYWDSFGGYLTSLLNWHAGLTYPGGRHSLAMVLDQDDAIEELNEDNNIYGEQFVWSPYPLTIGTPLVRVMPGSRTGGWRWVPLSHERRYNVDGLRTPKDSWWTAVWAMPGAASDVDLRLHTPAPGAKDGFAGPLASSGSGTGLLDYVLTNYNQTSAKPMDVGVLNRSGTQSYAAEAVGSITHGIANGMYGPYAMSTGHALALHEFYFYAGDYFVRLTNISGSVDWGLAVHPADLAFQGKSTALAADWFAGPGQHEQFLATIPASGWYCVTAWKRGSADLPLSGEFRLEIFPMGAGVEPGTMPVAAALGAVRPNPVLSQATVSFDLAREGPVTLVVHDVRGALVRTLIRGTWPAGRHEQVWDGRDDHDRLVPAGVYLLNFSAGGVHTTRKVVRVR